MKIITSNKKAYLDYDIHEKFEAWIVLHWHEVKSTKIWKINIRDSLVRIEWNEMFLINTNILLYEKTSVHIAKWYEPKRKRKLIVKRKEISKYITKTNKTWLVIIPLSVYVNKNRLIKVELWLWKLRRKIEKKQVIKERDIDRQARKELKYY